MAGEPMPDEDKREAVVHWIAEGLFREEHPTFSASLEDQDANIREDFLDRAADLLDRLEGEREPVAWGMFNEDGGAFMVELFPEHLERFSLLVEEGNTIEPLYRLRTGQDPTDPPTLTCRHCDPDGEVEATLRRTTDARNGP